MFLKLEVDVMNFSVNAGNAVDMRYEVIDNNILYQYPHNNTNFKHLLKDNFAFMRACEIQLSINNKKTQTFRNTEYLDAILNNFYDTEKYDIKKVANSGDWRDTYPRVVSRNYQNALSEGQSLFTWQHGTNNEKLVADGVGIDNSASRFTIFEQIYAPPICMKGRCFFSNMYEMLPGIKNFNIKFKYPDGIKLGKMIMFRDDVRKRFIGWGWGNNSNQQHVATHNASPDYDQRLIILKLNPTLIVQYSKNLKPPLSIPRYQSLSFNMYKRSILLDEEYSTVKFDSIKSGRVPRYLLIFVKPEVHSNLNIDPTADINTSYTNYYERSGTLCKTAEIKELKLRFSMNKNKYNRSISNKELFWLTKRSCNLDTSYDSFRKGLGYVCLDLRLLGLEDKFTNELTLFEMNLELQIVDHYAAAHRLMNVCVLSLFSNYFLDIKKSIFKFYDTYT